MAVFTQVTPKDLSEVLLRFNLGEVERLEGISAGIENTNYFLDTKASTGEVSRWVLTVFENLDSHELPYFVALTRHIAAAGLAVPAPLIDDDGHALIKLQGKDAMIVPCLSGRDKAQVSLSDCAAIGEWLARMHQALNDFKLKRPLVRDLKWMLGHLAELRESAIRAEDLRLLEHSIHRYEAYRHDLAKCPQGTVHGDLFKDNVLFTQDSESKIAGVIDFYHACNASLLFDLAVCANDWAHEGGLGYDQGKLNALVDAYRSTRPWTEHEEACWPLFLEAAALRFWISRLSSKYVGGYQQDSVAGDTIKNPDELSMIISQLQA